MPKPVKSKIPKEERNFWRTPDKEYEYANKEYGPFTLDAAADASNHKTDLWLGPGGLAEDALTVNWNRSSVFAPKHTVWINPPYIRKEGEKRSAPGPVEQFLYYARDQVAQGYINSATLLIPATTDSPWFHDLLWDSATNRTRRGVIVEFLRGRVNFIRPNGEKSGSPPFASMLVTFV